VNNAKHLNVIDQLRGIAILMVIIHHAFGYSSSIHPIPPASADLKNITNLFDFIFHCTIANGFLGVMIFFVLSGFCIRWSHLKSNDFTWKQFYQRRFFRIVPAYWFWLLIGCLVVKVEIWDVILHILLIHNVRADTFHSIISPFWSIAIEWQIYMLYPFVLIFASRCRKIWVLMFFAFANLGSSLLSSNPAAELLGGDGLRILGRLPTALMFSWVLGFYLANTLHEGGRVKTTLTPLAINLVLGLLAYMHPKTIFLASVPWSLAAYYIVAYFVFRESEADSGRFKLLAKIGIISYSVYLCHDLFANIYPYLEKELLIGRGAFMDGIVAFSLMITPVIFFGYISYRYVEIGGVKIGKLIANKNAGFRR
jgi:peptidoglycan/LPS O-acetylase OafA/YrhL